MLFNSYQFVFIFLPAVLLGYAAAQRYWGTKAGFGFLAGASLCFYGWWNPAYLALIVVSILFNYAMGLLQRRANLRSGAGDKRILWLGVAVNLGALAYFKYADFFINTGNALFGTDHPALHIVLPLAISFFTFTQLAFVVDAYHGMAFDYDFVEYAFFVLFFPHLIAGPIVRHHEILPQVKAARGGLTAERVGAGLTIFAIGLFKKVVIADSMGGFATPFFAAVKGGHDPLLVGAWANTLSYTLQLYFDFSGYSDMAIGLGYVFGVKMPLNFNSPYKARSVADFWQRWHMSLSRFLRDYLYIPLGGNRHGKPRQIFNLMVTMLLGGLWHGAGWTFVFWGGLHGFYLVLNHLWRGWTKGCAWASARILQPVYQALTFLAVVVGWVFFRADSFSSAVNILKGMIGLHGVFLPANPNSDGRMPGFSFIQLETSAPQVVWVAVLLLVVFCLPNTQEIMRACEPSINPVASTSRLMWRRSLRWGLLAGALFGVSVLTFGHVSEFLYFQF